MIPSSSLLRSYLGEAYLEGLRDDAAGTQFGIATSLDPNDPTPWLFDAIRKQIANRPVEALRALERSIALNDNRAPFRSRLLLDQDAATRGVALGRIYDDLGFEQLGRSEATNSLSRDPANPAAQDSSPKSMQARIGFSSRAPARYSRHNCWRHRTPIRSLRVWPRPISRSSAQGHFCRQGLESMAPCSSVIGSVHCSPA